MTVYGTYTVMLHKSHLLFMTRTGAMLAAGAISFGYEGFPLIQEIIGEICRTLGLYHFYLESCVRPSFSLLQGMTGSGGVISGRSNPAFQMKSMTPQNATKVPRQGSC